MTKSKNRSLPPRHLDLTALVDKKRKDLESKILDQAIDLYLATFGKEFRKGLLTVDYERVKNYSSKILTFRYDDVIMLRRFPMDLQGLKWMYLSPIFGDTFE